MALTKRDQRRLEEAIRLLKNLEPGKPCCSAETRRDVYLYVDTWVLPQLKGILEGNPTDWRDRRLNRR